MTDNKTNIFSSQIYTAAEVAEMVNSHSKELFGVDFGICSNWYNDDSFFEEVMSNIHNEADIDTAINLINQAQYIQTNMTHDPNVCFRYGTYKEYIPRVENLKEKLYGIRDRELRSRKILENRQQMMSEWTSNSTAPAHYTATDCQPVNTNEVVETSTTEYHLADLKLDVRNHILIDDDKRYNEFISIIKGPINEWIEKHRLQDWNVVRFVCRLHGILSKNSSMEVFAFFLEKIGLGDSIRILNNMKKRKDANDKEAIKKTALYRNKIFWKLKNDAKKIEEFLSDFIEES